MGFSEPHAPLDGFHVPMKRCEVVMHFVDGTESVHVLNMILQDGTERVIDRVDIDGELYEKERTREVVSCIYHGEHLYGYDEYELSCGHSLVWMDNEPPNYCPDCGARLTDG